MKPKTIILMVVAIGCGLAASYMTSRLLADRANKEQPEAKVKVLVAIKKVPAFEPIKKPEEYFAEKEVPEGTYPSKCLRRHPRQPRSAGRRLRPARVPRGLYLHLHRRQRRATG